MFSALANSIEHQARLEADLVAGRPAYTVFAVGKGWVFVHYSGRPSFKEADMSSAIARARVERLCFGLSEDEYPITLELGYEQQRT